MFKRLTLLAGAAALSLGLAGGATAAGTGIDLAAGGYTLGTEIVSEPGSGAFFGFSPGGGDVSIVGGLLGISIDNVPVGGPPAAFDPSDATSYRLSGVSAPAAASVAVGSSMEGEMQFLFEGVTGAGLNAGDDSPILAVFLADFTGEIGDDPFAQMGMTTAPFFEPFRVVFGTLTLNRLNAVNPIPVPAGLPLALTGLAVFGFVARKRAKRSA